MADVTARSSSSEELGLYVHVPFCRARCTYCAFATWTDRHEQQAEYFDAVLREIEVRCAGRTFDTVYFGGGTPSLPDPAHLAGVLDRVRRVGAIAPDAEVTLEVNPESVDAPRAEAWLRAGFNRASVGVQSFDASVLKDAGRLHGPRRAAWAFRLLRRAGFSRLSLDLIAGLPGETAASLRASRRRALDLEPDHVSLYLLELDEAGKMTPLAAAVRAGRVSTVSDDTLADWYEESRDDLAASGLPAYEISNFARPGSWCRHNVKYWTCAPFVGCGVAAHWLEDGVRRHNASGFEAYLRLVAEHGDGEADESRGAAPSDLAQDGVLLGLRLSDGIDLRDLDARWPGARRRFAPVLEKHLVTGLVQRGPAASTFRLTPRGALLSNEVFQDVIAA